eukprot:6322787-Alexandrium_andersonii.AAC.1
MIKVAHSVCDAGPGRVQTPPATLRAAPSSRTRPQSPASAARPWPWAACRRTHLANSAAAAA